MHRGDAGLCRTEFAWKLGSNRVSCFMIKCYFPDSLLAPSARRPTERGGIGCAVGDVEHHAVAGHPPPSLVNPARPRMKRSASRTEAGIRRSFVDAGGICPPVLRRLDGRTQFRDRILRDIQRIEA